MSLEINTHFKLQISSLDNNNNKKQTLFNKVEWQCDEKSCIFYKNKSSN